MGICTNHTWNSQNVGKGSEEKQTNKQQQQNLTWTKLGSWRIAWQNSSHHAKHARLYPTYSMLKRENLWQHWILGRGDLHFCFCNSKQRGFKNMNGPRASHRQKSAVPWRGRPRKVRSNNVTNEKNKQTRGPLVTGWENQSPADVTQIEKTPVPWRHRKKCGRLISQIQKSTAHLTSHRLRKVRSSDVRVR